MSSFQRFWRGGFAAKVCALLTATVLSVHTISFSVAEDIGGVTIPASLNPSNIPALASLFGGKQGLVNISLVWGDPDARDYDPSEDDYDEYLDGYYEWLEAELEEIDDLLPLLDAYNIKVLLVGHTPPGGFADTSPPEMHLFKASVAAEDFQAEFVSVWEMIAERYADDDRIYGFNLLGEAADKTTKKKLLPYPNVKNWHALAAELVEAIRAVDPDRRLYVAPLFSNPKKLGLLDKDLIKAGLDTTGLVYAFNFYEPLNYTHQGLSGAPSFVAFNSKVKKKINSALKAIKNFQKKNPTRDLFCAESSEVRWADKADEYLEYILTKFSSLNIGWVRHAVFESSVWDFFCGANKDDTTCDNEDNARLQVLKAFLLNNPA
jgi:hypothetical protein